jgi:hypothetical protein
MNFWTRKKQIEQGKKRQIKAAFLRCETSKTCKECGSPLKVTDALSGLFSVIPTKENLCITCSRKKFFEDES